MDCQVCSLERLYYLLTILSVESCSSRPVAQSQPLSFGAGTVPLRGGQSSVFDRLRW